MLPYGRQTIDDDDIKSVVETLKGDYLTTGPKVCEFEAALCRATGAKYAVAVANGTVAPHLACLVSGLKPGTAAIVPSLTFLATANAVRYCGADVVFCDVDPDTGLMTAALFQQALDKAHKDGLDVRAVLPVHLTGQPVDLAAIRDISDKHDINVIADSCHALGSHYDGKPVGAGHHEHFSTFSFHPVKTIAMGEGGAVTTNDENAAQRIRSLRHHGMKPIPEKGPWFYAMDELGFNFRLSDIQCALGVSQLSKLDHFIKRRAELVAIYNTQLQDLSPIVQTPCVHSTEFVGWHLYAPRIDFAAAGKSRKDVMMALKASGVGSQVHYIPVHSQPYYQGLYGDISLPGADHYYEHTLSLPLYPTMDDSDVDVVVRALKSSLGL